MQLFFIIEGNKVILISQGFFIRDIHQPIFLMGALGVKSGSGKTDVSRMDRFHTVAQKFGIALKFSG